VAGSPLELHSATPRELQARIAAERRGRPFLVYRDGSGGQAIMVLEDFGERLTVGRRAGNEVALGWDDEVSRVHTALERVGAGWVIADDGLSHNGTWVNGERVAGRRRLHDGDVILVGATTLAYIAPAADGSQPTATARRTARRRHAHRGAATRARRTLSALRPQRLRVAAHEPRDRRRARRERRRGQVHAAHAVRAVRRRIGTTCGCSIDAARRDSCRNRRRAFSSSRSSGATTFSATVRSR
jgi:FHA domain